MHTKVSITTKDLQARLSNGLEKNGTIRCAGERISKCPSRKTDGVCKGLSKDNCSEIRGWIGYVMQYGGFKLEKVEKKPQHKKERVYKIPKNKITQWRNTVQDVIHTLSDNIDVPRSAR